MLNLEPKCLDPKRLRLVFPPFSYNLTTPENIQYDVFESILHVSTIIRQKFRNVMASTFGKFSAFFFSKSMEYCKFIVVISLSLSSKVNSRNSENWCKRFQHSTDHLDDCVGGHTSRAHSFHFSFNICYSISISCHFHFQPFFFSYPTLFIPDSFK